MKKLLIFGMVLLMSVAAGSAYANLTFVFDPSNTFTGTAPTGSLTAEFIDVSPGTVDLVLTSSLAAGEKVSDMYFNYGDQYLSSLAFAITANTDGGAATVATGSNAFKADGDGFYDINFAFSTINPGSLTNGTSQTYRITGTNLDSGDFNFLSSPVDANGHGSSPNGTWLASVHVQGIAPNNTSGFVGGAPVPIPPSVWLLGSGLLGLVGIGRRMMLG